MSDHKKLAALEARVKQLEGQYEKHQIINKIAKEETTDKVGDLIRTAYDNISQAIVDAKRDDNVEAIPALIALKKDVPKKYAISKESMLELNKILNSLVGSSVQ